ncbi:MAG TPA: HAMP domain-containing sensor histidine kinase, partial [Thermoanaerobaculia bacterium]|nr:HAMP domain-containing sensor histidine kinase [Thermoanaerobaculia bacterium]
ALFAAELARNGSLAIDNARLYFDSQQAVRSREEVLAVVSHDLRNPLNAVSLAASLLRSSDTISAEEREQLEIMAVSVERMRRLVEDLLDVTRLEGGKRLPLERSRLDAEALLRETYELFKVQTEAAGIELRHEVPRNLPQLWGDRHRILQVLSNLVGNAMKFTPAGGSITIRAAQHGGMLQLSVSDTGSGIPQEHLKDIFNTYWQAKRTERLGAGLGLPIAKGVVEAHGGRIWVESNPERGATFHFTIPVAVGVKAERREESPAHH